MSDYCRPKRVVLDICTLCQLDCRDCYMRTNRQYTGNGYLDGKPSVGMGYLKFEKFKNFIDGNPFIKEIELSNCGEIFLNPDLEKMLEYAYKKKIKLMAWTGTNMNTVSDRILEALVKYQFVGTNVSIDGASDEVYKMYRRKGSFTQVINNIKKLLEYKKKYNSHFPIINWNYIVMDCTQEISEIKKAKEMAKDMGIDIIFRKTYVNTFFPKDPEAIYKETGLSYKNTGLEDIQKRFAYKFPRTYCVQFFTQPRINWDGRLFGCCCSHEGWDVNVFEMGLEKALKSVNVLYARKMLMHKLPVRSCGPCSHCWEFERMKKEGLWVSKIEIE